MRGKLIISFIFILAFSLNLIAQDALKKWHSFDFSKGKLTSAQLNKLEHEQLQLLRGIVFGKRGRIFKEKNIQEYLEKQSWYKPKSAFSNSVLTKMERDNLDLIRLEEARRHDYVEPGDLRLWQNKEIPDEKLYTETAAGWRILIAEIEAIHGKRFDDEPWLQKYFEERYWYKPNPNYNPSVLNAFERKNLENLNAKRSEYRNTEVSVGDMDKFQNVLLKEEQLNGLTFNDLRLIRNEFWARRGRKFQTPGFRAVFDWRDWYKPLKDQSKVKLSAIEEQNVKLIESIEAKMREKIANEPITAEMLEGLFVEDLRVLRNEIYARRGRVFKDPELQKYFAAQPWYQPNPDFKDEMLSETESKNLAVIREVEQYAISKFSEFEG
ncbi:MAG TPA: YARHG domain-containing protein [Pyrinomonadaceae bacterium]|nr:YARHG domain-containing protein [Pyrinomonadaceae bacterium]